MDQFKRSITITSSSLAPHISQARTRCHNLLKEIQPHLSNPSYRYRIYGALFAVVSLIALTQYLIHRNRILARRANIPSTPTLEKATHPSSSAFKAPSRIPGTWTTSNFKTPTPVAYEDWDIETTKPLPYRPFRYGPKYFVTMGLRNVRFEDWIELDNHFPRFHGDKKRRIEERGAKCCRTLGWRTVGAGQKGVERRGSDEKGFEGVPGMVRADGERAIDAAVELLEELAMYLPERYPSLYQKTEVGLKNLWSGEEFDIRKDHLVEDPMQMAGRLVQDDLAIMFEKEDGQYYLLAGSILLAGFWRLSDKFGMVLSEIHTSGDVPQFREKLEKGMMNFFRRLKCEEMVARNNYFLQVDDDLAWSYSIGDEDSASVSWDTAEKDKAIEHHFFRSERQTLRRLPRSGGVVFTIRTYFHPVKEVATEPGVAGRLASAVRSWGNDVSKYKGRERYGDVLVEWLDKEHERQVRESITTDEEEDKETKYPW